MNGKADNSSLGWAVGQRLVLWFNPSQQLSTMQLLAHSPHTVGWGRESGKKTPRGLR